MSNEFAGLPSHSAEYFGESRDYWWNEDFLRFLSTRWRTDQIRTMLDVGCGVGHWSRLLMRILPQQAHLHGVDRDLHWVQKSVERAATAGLANRCQFQVATAEQLPFVDASFDLVTCQTLLMHLRDPAVGLAEMIRVTRPGGLVLVAEPTNLLGPALLDSIALGDSPELVASVLQFQLICQRGKARVGEGDDLIGEQVPALFKAAWLRDIEVRLNDRPSSWIPPYDSLCEQAMLREFSDHAARDFWIWSRAETLCYFLAGGGCAEAFNHNWSAVTAFHSRLREAISTRKFSSAGGSLFYLVWGWKK